MYCQGLIVQQHMQSCSMYWELVVGTVLSELLGVSNYMIINMLSTCVHLKESLFQLQIATNFHIWIWV